jgi:hypothetical protein
LPDDDDQRLTEQLFGAARPDPASTRLPLPDFTHIQHDLTTNRQDLVMRQQHRAGEEMAEYL